MNYNSSKISEKYTEGKKIYCRLIVKWDKKMQYVKRRAFHGNAHNVLSCVYVASWKLLKYFEIDRIALS